MAWVSPTIAQRRRLKRPSTALAWIFPCLRYNSSFAARTLLTALLIAVFLLGDDDGRVDHWQRNRNRFSLSCLLWAQIGRPTGRAGRWPPAAQRFPGGRS